MILCADCECEMSDHVLKFEEDLPIRTRCNKCQRCSRFVFPKRRNTVLIPPQPDRTPTARWEWLIQIR